LEKLTNTLLACGRMESMSSANGNFRFTGRYVTYGWALDATHLFRNHNSCWREDRSTQQCDPSARRSDVRQASEIWIERENAPTAV
jgi:hypothetical protein